MRTKATPDGQIPFTPEEEAEADIVQAEWLAGEPARLQAIEDAETNKTNLSTDALINILKTKTLPEIETQVADMFSGLAGMEDSQIDAYIDGKTIEADTKAILKTLAKDIKSIIKVLKIDTKIAIYLAKRELN